MKRILSVVLLALIAPRTDAEETLKLVQTIPLPGVQGRFDHFAIDLKGRRLFVAALGNNSADVFLRRGVESVLRCASGPRFSAGGDPDLRSEALRSAVHVGG